MQAGKGLLTSDSNLQDVKRCLPSGRQRRIQARLHHGHGELVKMDNVMQLLDSVGEICLPYHRVNVRRPAAV